MAFSGAGVFSRIHNWIADRDNGIKITAVRHDAEDDGFATGLSNTICRDGQSTITAAIPFSAQKITDLGNATADADALNRITADNRLTNKAECRLAYVSTVQIKLSPYGGNQLMIAGLRQVVPSAGVTLANTALSVSTVYYIYAYMNAAVMTLEASATGFATDTTTGMPIKSGDSTRTLVGKIATDTSGLFGDLITYVGVLSYWNRRPKKFAITGSGSTASGSSVQLLAGNVLAWADEGSLIFNWVGYAANSGTNSNFASITYDGNGSSEYVTYTPLATAGSALGGGHAYTVAAEGTQAAVVLYTRVNGGTGTFSAFLLTTTVMG